MSDPSVSIVIRAKNEVGSIGRALHAVFSQDLKPAEVIVVDSGSTDGTLDVVKRYPVKLVSIPPEAFTFGYALNVGTDNAAGELAVYLSADAEPADAKWLNNLVAPFADQMVAGVYGKQVAYPGHNPIEEWKLARIYGPLKRVQTDNPFFSNANSCIRRSVWQQTPFVESLPGTEDHVWAKSVQGRGLSIVYQPGAVVFHSHRTGLRDMYRRRFREAQGLRLTKGGWWWVLSRLAHPPLRGWVSVASFLIGRRYSYRWVGYALVSETLEWWASIAGSIGMQTPGGEASPASARSLVDLGRPAPSVSPEGSGMSRTELSGGDHGEVEGGGQTKCESS